MNEEVDEIRTQADIIYSHRFYSIIIDKKMLY